MNAHLRNVLVAYSRYFNAQFSDITTSEVLLSVPTRPLKGKHSVCLSGDINFSLHVLPS
jgi:hypothetical protein